MKQFHVIETECYPAKWKVESTQWPGTDNGTHNYFRKKEDADIEANRRNNFPVCHLTN